MSPGRSHRWWARRHSTAIPHSQTSLPFSLIEDNQAREVVSTQSLQRSCLNLTKATAPGRVSKEDIHKTIALKAKDLTTSSQFCRQVSPFECKAGRSFKLSPTAIFTSPFRYSQVDSHLQKSKNPQGSLTKTHRRALTQKGHSLSPVAGGLQIFSVPAEALYTKQ